MREVDVVDDQPPLPALASPPRKAWYVNALGPDWRPPPSELELHPVPGLLRVYPEGLVFYPDDAVDVTTGRPLSGLIAPETILEAAAFTPGTRMVPSEVAGSWMPRWQRRWRCPGFSVLLTTGRGWGFECHYGHYRANFVTRYYLGKWL